MSARAGNAGQNREHYVGFSYSHFLPIREDSNEDRNPASLAGDTVLPTYPKTVQYTITPALTGGGGTIRFNVRGRITPDGNIQVTLPADVVLIMIALFLTISGSISAEWWEGLVMLNKKGISLVEIMIALVVLLLVSLALMQTCAGKYRFQYEQPATR